MVGTISSNDPVARFFGVVEAHPTAIAVSGNEELTYGELGSKVRQLATWIVEETGKQHPRVLVSLPQGASAYVGMLATLTAGGQYCPLNLDMPAQRRMHIADSFEADIGLAVGGDREGLPSNLAILDIANVPNRQFAMPRKADAAAYTIFTSGSTGVPKGVVVGRSGLAHYLDWAIPALDLGPGRRCSQHPNIAFDLSVIDIYGALCSGATLVPMVSSRDRLMPALAVKERQVDIWVSVPSVIDLMVRGNQATMDMLGNVKTFYFCGEPLLPAHLEVVFAAAPKALVINAYGPTEATVSCTELFLTAENFREACGASCAIGEAINGMTLTLDGGTTEDEGEIVIHGPQVALGYWRDDSLTMQRFGTNLLSGEQFFRTGDWAKRENGHLFFIARIDRQVKLNGHRIELGEIDAALRELLSGQAVVTVLAGEKIISFVEQASIDAMSLRTELRQILPDYMIPHEIRSLEQLPRNANDKIDVRALNCLL